MKKVITNTLAKAIADAVAKKVSAERAIGSATKKVVDGFVAEGITVEMLTAPKGKDADRTFYDSVQCAVVAGFAVTVQEMLKKETKTLKRTDTVTESKLEHTTANKSYWQKQIGSKIKDLRNALDRRLNPKDSESNGANETSTLESRIRRDLAKYIAQLEKVEQFSGNVVELTKCLKSALVYVKA